MENGLGVHISRKHKDIEQLDGSDSVSDDMDVDDKYVKTLHYWEKGRLSTVMTWTRMINMRKQFIIGKRKA